MKTLDPEAFQDLLGQSKQVFRWMPRRDYLVDREQAAFADRLLPPDVDWWREYMATMTHWTAAPPDGEGKVVQRVIVDDGDGNCPYQQWLAAADPFLREVGEDLRRIPREVAIEAGLPGYDFFVLIADGATALVLPLYDGSGRVGDRILVDYADSPDLVGQHCAWRDLALNHAPAVALPAA